MVHSKCKEGFENWAVGAILGGFSSARGDAMTDVEHRSTYSRGMRRTPLERNGMDILSAT